MSKKKSSPLVAQRRAEYAHLSDTELLALVREKDAAHPEDDAAMEALDTELFHLEEELSARDLAWPNRG